jgi:hypothetical protein
MSKVIPLPPVSKEEAMRIASTRLAENVRELPMTCHSTRPENCTLYLPQAPSEPCWYIYAPWSDEKDVLTLRSNRLILVGKLTGTIYHDGSAGNEG